jgi:hypothetical protein
VNCYLPYFSLWLICCLLPAIYFCSLCLLKVCTKSWLSPLLWWKGLPDSYFCKLCLLKVHEESCLFPPSPVKGLACHLLCLLKVLMESSFLHLTPPQVCSRPPALSAACPFQFFVYYSVCFFFFCGAKFSLSRGLCWFILEWL